MKFSLIWLPKVLRSAGLNVTEVPGWESRGRGDVGEILGVLCHHTAGAKKGNMPSLDLIVNGRKDLPGPLSQLGLGRDGTYYVIAAGKCHHAGAGHWKGVRAGNTHFIGIEAENTGLPNDSPWPAAQIDAYQRGVAAILKHVGRPFDFCVGHKEYAPSRKIDPSFEMEPFRKTVALIMEGGAPTPEVISPAEPGSEPVAPVKRPTPTITVRAMVKLGSTGDVVKQLQNAIGVAPDGTFGPKTEAAVKAFQREHKLGADGVVGPATWAALDAVEETAG